MATESGQPRYSGPPHARAGDPETSHEAAAKVERKISKTCAQILRAYASGLAITDHEAYRRVGLDNGGRFTHQRCSDLRSGGYIERLKDRGLTPSGNSAFLSRITPKGKQFLRLRPVVCFSEDEDGEDENS